MSTVRNSTRATPTSRDSPACGGPIPFALPDAPTSKAGTNAARSHQGDLDFLAYDPDVVDGIGEAPRGHAIELFDRQAQLSAIDGALAAASGHQGRLVVFEGPAGIGKSRLLEEARIRARARGMRVLRARGGELEQDLSCGVAVQLFGPPLGTVTAAERKRLFGRLPGPVRSLLGVPGFGGELDEAGEFALLHGLFMLAADLADSAPLALLVDDGHWVDAPSLRFVAYLASRLEELRIAVLVAHRPGEQSDATELVAHLREVPGAMVDRLGPLEPDSVAAIVRTELSPDAGDDLCEVCASLTGGNPFYLHELLVALQREGVPVAELSVARLRKATPASISRAVLARAGRLPAGAAQLAQAVAILGSEVELRHAAALAELNNPAALRAMDALASVEIFAGGEPLTFVHPLVADAVAADLPPGQFSALHLHAAELLADDRAEPERVGAHLLHAPRRGNAWAVDMLCAAAHQARSRGGQGSAARLLERALAEPPLADRRADVLVELGHAEAAAGRTSAPDRFASALDLIDDPDRRAEIQRAHGHALYIQGRHREAAQAFDAGLQELGGKLGDKLASELQAGYVAAATIDPDLRAEALARVETVVSVVVARPVGRPTPGERAILAQAALHHSLAAAPREMVRDLAVRAWDDGALLVDETAAGFNWTLVTGALDFTDELEVSLGVCDAAMVDARRLGSPLAFATASYERSIPLYHMGRIAEATADVQAAVDATRYGWHMYARSAAYTLALCQIELAELEAAEQTLKILEREPAESSIEHPALLDARAILRRRQGRNQESLADHLEAGRLFVEVFGVLTTGDVDWRTGAAESALALGDRKRAHDLAAEGLEFSRSVGLTRGVVGSLRVLGHAEGGTSGLSLLEEAVNQADPAPARLEYMRALVDFGAALLRAGRRQAAEDPLRRALHTATSQGANALAARAAVELRATGARPRRAMLSGLESLTPSERRIAELAAGSATNREIAQHLFVTRKTVEFHLRHVYQKLDIKSRNELSAALAPA